MKRDGYASAVEDMKGVEEDWVAPEGVNTVCYVM
tara:strand:+ start:841 stop:942 length:102 start_codon:yes stop_codon:yes gene_type:complete